MLPRNNETVLCWRLCSFNLDWHQITQHQTYLFSHSLFLIFSSSCFVFLSFLFFFSFSIISFPKGHRPELFRVRFYLIETKHAVEKNLLLGGNRFSMMATSINALIDVPDEKFIALYVLIEGEDFMRIKFCFIIGTEFFCLWGYRDNLSYFNERITN